MAVEQIPGATRTLADIAPLIPELIVIIGAFALLMLDLFINERQRFLMQIGSVAVLLLATVAIIAGWGPHATVLDGMFIRDTFADGMKASVLIISALVICYSWSYLRERSLYKGEIPVLILFSVAGMMLLISAGNMTVIYVGLELLALSSYALVAVDRDNPRSTEAGMKYFVLGSMASGLLLYGMSLVYGATHSLDIQTIYRTAEGVYGTSRILLLAGMVFMVAGIAFKFGAVPFHMWLPDTYQGAPTPITSFISSVPKIATLGMAYRLLVEGFGNALPEWQTYLAILAAVSLIIGNVIAIAQSNLKRMLAYSTISHVGFLFMGLAAGTQAGYASSMFYIITYAVMSVAAFGAIIYLSRAGFEADNIDDFKGLSTRDPVAAVLVLFVMASLGGVPPFLGFWAKFAVFRAALGGDLLWLAILSAVCAVIGMFYYLRVIKVMYFDSPVDTGMTYQPGSKSVAFKALFGVNAIALLILGIAWNPLMALCVRAFS